VVITSIQGGRNTTPVTPDQGSYLSWAIDNPTQEDATETFYVDILLDGVVLDRWISDGLEADRSGVFTDWERLDSLARLEPGEHTLTLIVDSTNLVSETDESDNTFETTLVVLANSDNSDEGPPPTRLPDLAPFVPSNWPAPIVASAYSDGKLLGPLSANVLTYVRYSFMNQGRASAPENVYTQLYYDGVLVSKEFWSGAILGDEVVRQEWDGLAETVRVTPGEHTLKFLIDPHNLIMESDETNNSYEVTLLWGSGEVPPLIVPTPIPVLSLPEPPTMPNLVPGWRFGWDGPLIVSNVPDTFKSGHVMIGEAVYIDVVVRNESSVDLTDPYQIHLYFDDQLVQTLDVNDGTPAGSTQWWPDWDRLDSEVDITEGLHILRLEIDEENQVSELDETDNSFVKEIQWFRKFAPAEPTTSYTEDDLKIMLADLRELLDSDQKVIISGNENLSDRVMEAATAGYYLLTGRRLVDENVEITLLSHQGFFDWLDGSCAEDFVIKDPSQYQSIRDECERAKSEALGFTTTGLGKVIIVVDAERSAADVINTLAHEFGHMRQKLVHPEQSEGDRTYALRGILEAEAQQFQRTIWLAMEERTSLSLLTYPDYPAFHSVVDQNLDFRLRDIATDEHSLGFMIQWLAVLDDPALSDLRLQLLFDGSLNRESSANLFDYLLAIPHEEIPGYVNDRIRSLESFEENIRSMAKARLIAGLNPDLEGVPELRIVGLLTP
jgi:hypothetical protein